MHFFSSHPCECMNKTLMLGIAVAVAHSAIAQETNPTAPNDLLKYYAGDFTDTDGDGMSDVGEKRYGYDPDDNKSFPLVDFIAEPLSYTPVVPAMDGNPKIAVSGEGIVIVWEDANATDFSLLLYDGERELYYGGHAVESADVNYSTFDLNGTETLRGRFTESRSDNGEWVRELAWFEIDLTDFPVPPKDVDLASPEDKITYRLEDFEPEMEDKTISFLTKLTPILNDVLGPPAETFVCTFVNQGFEADSWMSTDHGRTMLCDDSWNPRLLVHELVHAWKGKYGFTNNGGDDWSYSTELSGFEENAEGLAYEILHDYVEAYPNDEVSIETLEWHAWGNWSAKASIHDVIKHQRYTGAGDFWTDMYTVNDRYSVTGMTMQIMQKHDEDFFKNMMSRYYDKIESEPDWRPNREDLIDLWASELPFINGIDTRTYLNAIPVFNGKKLEGFFPIIMQRPSSQGGDKIIFSSYADKNGYLWWDWVTEENLDEQNFPEWIDRFLGDDGFYYVNVQDQPIVVNVSTIYGEEVTSYSARTGDSKFPDGGPDTLGWYTDDRSHNDLAPNQFLVGLYKERLEYTNYTPYTDESSENFYFFGYEGFQQNQSEYVIFVGIDSQVAEEVSIQIGDETYASPLVNGCAVFRSLEWVHNLEGGFSIHVTGNGKTNVYQRTLINAGTPDGCRQQQFLVIDQDFDGIEDLYDSEIVPLINEDHPSYADINNALAAEGTDRGNGWREADWFGYYFPTSSEWLYHAEHGWIYPQTQTLDSIWYWDTSLGWCWTSQDVYPYVYRDDPTGWLRYHRESRNPRYFYDYETKAWTGVE